MNAKEEFLKVPPEQIQKLEDNIINSYGQATIVDEVLMQAEQMDIGESADFDAGYAVLRVARHEDGFKTQFAVKNSSGNAGLPPIN